MMKSPMNDIKVLKRYTNDPERVANSHLNRFAKFLFLIGIALVSGIFLLLSVLILVAGEGSTAGRISAALLIVLGVVIVWAVLYAHLRDRLEVTPSCVRCTKYIFFIRHQRTYPRNGIRVKLYPYYRYPYVLRLYDGNSKRPFFTVEYDEIARQYFGEGLTDAERTVPLIPRSQYAPLLLKIGSKKLQKYVPLFSGIAAAFLAFCLTVRQDGLQAAAIIGTVAGLLTGILMAVCLYFARKK